MRKVINDRTQMPDPEVLAGFKALLSIYSPSCVIADSQERMGVMASALRPLTTQTRFVGPALTVQLEPGNQVDCLDALSVAQAGDVIVVDDYMGQIDTIGITSTRIRSLGGEQITISNSNLMGTKIRNYKRMAERRVLFKFGVTYETPNEKLKKIPEIVKRIPVIL